MARGGIKTFRRKPNFALLISIVSLVGLGAILISSASAVLGKQLHDDPSYFFREHIIAVAVGAVLMFFAYRIDYNIWKKLSIPLIALGLLLLLATFIPGVGYELNGARSWIKWPFYFSPNEPFKLALIVYLAAWLSKKGDSIKSLVGSAIPFWAILGATSALIMLQPDMGTLMIIVMIASVMYFVAGASYFHVATMVAAGLAGVALLIKSAPYRLSRFTIFLNPSADESGAGYQINQALLAISTGGIFGLGFGQSRQKFNYLPEAASDSIFAITAEELGFIKSAFIILLFVVVAVQGYRVAQKAPDAFSRLLATGITTWIVIQAGVNLLAMMSLIPLTGVPLPFLSHGSTSTIMLMIASGILLNISCHTEGENRESRSLRRRNWWSYITGSRSN